jgi:hypothetical protein
LHKSHMIHSHWRFALPRSYGRALGAEKSVQWLWWKSAFTFHEVMEVGLEAQERELEEYVRRTYPYPEWKLTLSKLWRRVSPLPRRAVARALRTIRRSADRS